STLWFFHCLPLRLPSIVTPSVLFYALPLHDALPISCILPTLGFQNQIGQVFDDRIVQNQFDRRIHHKALQRLFADGLEAAMRLRSEEHTSELQSRFDLVCRLLLEKKKMTGNACSLSS